MKIFGSPSESGKFENSQEVTISPGPKYAKDTTKRFGAINKIIIFNK
jgi:hypothetical protein